MVNINVPLHLPTPHRPGREAKTQRMLAKVTIVTAVIGAVTASVTQLITR